MLIEHAELCLTQNPFLSKNTKEAFMRPVKFLVIFLVSLLSQSIFAQQAQQDVERKDTLTTSPGAGTRTQTLRTTATVVGLDNATRQITLKQPSGKVVTLDAGDEVRNFDQLRLGDVVNIEYTQALSLELKKTPAGNRPRVEQKSTLNRALEGAKPGGTAGNQVRVLADVVAVHPKDQLITLRGPEGHIVNLKVQDPEQLKHVKKGDHVQATYTESLAISVQPQSSGASK
jgi:hypothetical protein